jgi:hypothetical protein
MDKFQIIIIAFVAFNIVLVIGVMWVVRYMKLDQKRRQKKLVELAIDKDKAERVSELKSEIIEEKEKTLEKYREYIKLS